MESEHYRILLVENLERLGRMVALYLFTSGYELATLSDPADVEGRLLADPPHLVIFNTGMEAGEKSTYINRWREAAPVIKVLEISSSPWIIRPSMKPDEIGAPDYYLDIPFQFEQLAAAVRICLGQPPNEPSGDAIVS